MATWTIRRRQPDAVHPMGSWAVTYLNHQTGQVFDCGTTRGDCPAEMLEAWVMEHADPMDVLDLPSGRTMKTAPASA